MPAILTRAQLKAALYMEDVQFAGSGLNDWQIGGAFTLYDTVSRRTEYRITVSEASPVPERITATYGETVLFTKRLINPLPETVALANGLTLLTAGNVGHVLNDYIAFTAAVIEPDRRIDRVIRHAQAQLERACGGVTWGASADTTQTFDARPIVDGGEVSNDGTELYFRTWLASIASATNGTGEAVTLTDLELHPLTGPPYYSARLKSGSGLQWFDNGEPEGSIAITGRWAGEITPSDETRDTLVALATYYYQQDIGQRGAVATKAGKGKATDMDWPEDVRRFVARWLFPAGLF